MPSPGEIFSALGKTGKADWGALFKRRQPAPHTSRPLIALDLGTRIADGFLAAEAQDRQQLKNVSTEIKMLAQSLGLAQDFVARSNSITDFADARRWDSLAEELDAALNEMSATMRAQHDGDLAVLMSFGCWLRSLEVVSAHFAAEWSADGANVFHQPGVADFFAARIGAMPAKTASLRTIAELRTRLTPLSAAVTFASENAPSAQAATALHDLTAGMCALIAAPEK